MHHLLNRQRAYKNGVSYLNLELGKYRLVRASINKVTTGIQAAKSPRLATLQHTMH